MENKELLESLLKQREELLKKNPHLREFQKQIDERLDNTPAEYRQEVINMMLVEKLQELKNGLAELKGILEK